MGFGDEIIGAGLARGAAARGKRVAFGDGQRVIWHDNARLIFARNPNVAPPGTEWCGDVEWIKHYPGRRVYCDICHDRSGRHWRFTPGRVTPGEMYFSAEEIAAAAAMAPESFILIEPNTKHQAPNKQWGHDRYAQIARALSAQGCRVAQFAAGGVALDRVEQIRTVDFRVACAVLQRARLYIGPEGGLHHAAAALGVPAVVIFGGFISPAVTGYAMHTNIFTGDELGCGRIDPCNHCRQAMSRIGVAHVLHEAHKILEACDERGRADAVESVSQA